MGTIIFSWARVIVVITLHKTSIVSSPNIDSHTFIKNFVLKSNRFSSPVYCTVVKCGFPQLFVKIRELGQRVHRQTPFVWLRSRIRDYLSQGEQFCRYFLQLLLQRQLHYLILLYAEIGGQKLLPAPNSFVPSLQLPFWWLISVLLWWCLVRCPCDQFWQKRNTEK